MAFLKEQMTYTQMTYTQMTYTYTYSQGTWE